MLRSFYFDGAEIKDTTNIFQLTQIEAFFTFLMQMSLF